MKNALNILLFLLAGTLVYDNCDAMSGGRRNQNLKKAAVYTEAKKNGGKVDDVKKKDAKVDEPNIGNVKKGYVFGSDVFVGVYNYITVTFTENGETRKKMIYLEKEDMEKLIEKCNFDVDGEYAYITVEELDSILGKSVFPGDKTQKYGLSKSNITDAVEVYFDDDDL